MGARETAALATTLTELHTCLPAARLAEVPARPGRPAGIAARIRTWQAAGLPRAQAPEVSAALRGGLRWLDGSDVARPSAGAVPAVFGPGDGNLANYLWDGARVRVVDFEESGRSDRAFEIAEVTEHVSAWLGGSLDVPGLLHHLDLTPAETARLTECRRLLALVWLFMLALDAPDRPRNPPGTAARQARRLLDLLG
ncbi:hypothetical protein GCM10025734_06870 [Kitasatospora paranensis]